MKKLFTALVVCLLICTSVLAACGSPEENFKKATQKFDNFTVEAKFEPSRSYCDGFYLIKADNMLKFIEYSSYGHIITAYAKSENNQFFCYDFLNKKWKIEDNIDKFNGITFYHIEQDVIAALMHSFFDDYTISNGEYVLKDSALSAYSEYFSGTLTSFRVTLKGDCFEKAIAIEQTGTKRIQYTYTFSNFGSSKIDIK